MLILEVHGKSLFVKLLDVLPECGFLISDEPQLHPLICLVGRCHRGQGCMEKLAVRTKCLFDQFTEAQLLVLYFRYRDRPKYQRAGIFWRDMREPYYITMNPYSWEKLKSLGCVYEWEFPKELFLSASDNLVQIGKSIV